MNERLPYYMAYPMPLQYDDDRIEQRDFEYMKSMYPMTVKRILPYVEAECDRMSYAGSVIYDEYPDQLQIHMMCNRVYDQVRQMEAQDDLEVEMQQYRRDGRNGRDGRNDRLRDLVQLLIFQELFRRRNRHRRDRRRFY